MAILRKNPIQWALEVLGRDQFWIAEKADIDRTIVNKHINGKREVSEADSVKYARAFRSLKRPSEFYQAESVPLALVDVKNASST